MTTNNQGSLCAAMDLEQISAELEEAQADVAMLELEPEPVGRDPAHCHDCFVVGLRELQASVEVRHRSQDVVQLHSAHEVGRESLVPREGIVGDHLVAEAQRGLLHLVVHLERALIAVARQLERGLDRHARVVGATGHALP